VARTVRECDLIGAAESDGLKTMQSWLRGHAHLADSEAARLAGAGRALEQLPAVAAGSADGAITAGQVEMIARVAEPDRLAAAAEAARSRGNGLSGRRRGRRRRRAWRRA
jgi:hypothetical protein